MGHDGGVLEYYTSLVAAIPQISPSWAQRPAFLLGIVVYDYRATADVGA
jgi:hypothetical protein